MDSLTTHAHQRNRGGKFSRSVILVAVPPRSPHSVSKDGSSLPSVNTKYIVLSTRSLGPLNWRIVGLCGRALPKLGVRPLPHGRLRSVNDKVSQLVSTLWKFLFFNLLIYRKRFRFFEVCRLSSPIHIISTYSQREYDPHAQPHTHCHGQRAATSSAERSVVGSPLPMQRSKRSPEALSATASAMTRATSSLEMAP